MGANHSSQSGGTAASAEVKTSYYELLGVERHATDEDIKKAYRRKALELHPDRNFGQEDEATRLFAEIQAAYEVLSDPQERSWYDSHESQILRGDEAGEEAHYERNIRLTTADEIFHMIRSFNSRIEFSDAPTGFYGFLRETFEKLAKEEVAAAEWEDIDSIDYPSFGNKDDSYEDVVKPFYAVWGSFSTKKSFAWRDKYRYSDAPDRRYRRAMEKENQRFRDEGKREFNDAVKTLVAFVKKRDPRYSTNAVSDSDRLKALRDAAAAQAARQRAENEARMKDHVVPEWAQAQTMEEQEEDEGEEEEQEEEVFECVPCHKTFKSERQYDAHEKSKKHQKAVHALKKKMRKENEHLNLDAVSSSGLNTPMTEDSQDPTDNLDAVGVGEDEVIDSFDNLDLDAERNSGGGANRDKDRDKDSHPLVDDSNREDRELSDESEPEEDEPVEESARNSSLAENLSQPSRADGTIGEAESATHQSPKLGKAAQKRAKRAAQAAAAEQQELKFKCVTCNAGFPSKTRLFQHISDFGHAAPTHKATKGTKGKKR